MCKISPGVMLTIESVIGEPVFLQGSVPTYLVGWSLFLCFRMAAGAQLLHQQDGERAKYGFLIFKENS